MGVIQYVYDDKGDCTAAIIPIELYKKMARGTDLAVVYESIPYARSQSDDETIPHEVITLMVENDVSLQAAWRMHRGMSQQNVAEALGVKQSAISNMEKRLKPQAATRERLAELYHCRVGQLTLD